MIWEYGIDLSWDTFYARREDISQSGLYPNPPFTTLISSVSHKYIAAPISIEKVCISYGLLSTDL